MIVVLGYLFWLGLSALVVMTWAVLMIGFYLLAFAVAVVICILRAIVEHKRPAVPHLPHGPRIPRPTPQARFSDRR